MKKTKFRNLQVLSMVGGLGALVGSLFSGCGKDNPVTPENQAPVVDYFTESPGSVAQGGSAHYSFKAHDPDGTLDSLVLVSSDGSRKKWTPGSSAYQDSATFVCNTPGPQTATFTAYDNEGAKATESRQFTVQGNAPPVVNTATLNGFEGVKSAVALDKIVSDAEHDPLTVQVTPSPGLDVHIVHGVPPAVDSLVYGMIDPDANGPAWFGVSVSDGHNAPVLDTIKVMFAAMDKLGGVVFQRLDSYLATVSPELVMPKPWGGKVYSGTDSASINPDGSFVFPNKFPAGPHIIKYQVYSIADTRDSAFPVTVTVPAGDNTSLQLRFYSNAGTGSNPGDPPLPLWLVKAFYNQVNDLSNVGGADPANKIIYLAGKDTTWDAGNSYLALTPTMQDTIADRLESGFLIYYEPGKRPTIVKGKQTDNLPLRWVSDVGSYLIPAVNYFIGFRGTSGLGAAINFDWDHNGETESAIVTLMYDSTRFPGGFHLGTTFQEYATPFIQTDAGATLPALVKQTCLFEGQDEAADHVTGLDRSLISIVKNDRGKNLTTYFSP